MRIAIIGAGIVGVSTAYALSADGHEVTVYEAGAGIAGEASAATAGLVAAGHSYAWASPAAPGMLVRSLFGTRTAIRVKPRVDLDLMRWGLRFLSQCTSERFIANTRLKYTLADYSRQVLAEITEAEDIAHSRTTSGVLYLHRDQRQLDRAARQTRILREFGRDQQILDADQILRIEPQLAGAQVDFVGAVYDPSDGTGDPHRFALELSRRATERGVVLTTGVEVTSLETEGEKVVAAHTTQGPVVADQYVLATGSSAADLAATAGVHLPVYPAKGYSVTVPWRDGEPALGTGGIDETTLVAWSPFEDGLRLSATAEFAGHDTTFRSRDFAAIRDAGDRLFPGRLDWEQAHYRAGLRPMTPDGPPFLGRTHHSNLLVNAGHGHLGWTMASGSARIIRDLVAGRPSPIPVEAYSPMRMAGRGRPGIGAPAHVL
ncbi:D-amino acid dehydrogenase [Streptomyces sp. NPDC102360]|uniref:D-amino acid dehydrogenase n=1 Tax=Streptomyces sp. NPDC102360 TaxID=3366160 RepID=UPI0037F54FCC